MKEEFIYIEDENLLKVINNTLGRGCVANPVTVSDMESLTKLDAHSKEVKSIKGLECAVNLGILYIASNEIKDLSPLKKLVNLKRLDLSYNKIEDISSLKNLVDLEELDLSANKIKDLSPLRNLNKDIDLVAYRQKVYVSNFEDVEIRDKYNKPVDLTPFKFDFCKKSPYGIKLAEFKDLKNNFSAYIILDIS